MSDSLFFRRWYGLGIVLLLIMVSIGGVTRLTESGLSMVTWEPISGILPPLSDAEWNIEFDNYKNYPEFKLLNKSITLEGFKKIFFWEYLHRIFGRLIGLYFILPFLYLIIKKKIDKMESFRITLLISMVAIQGLIGWYMVQSGLSINPHVSHFRLMIHLLAAMFLIVYTYYQYIRYAPPFYNRYEPILSKNMSLIVLLLVLVQIIYGSFVAGLKAGYAYNTFPLMNGSIFPVEFFSLGGFYESIFYEPYTIQFIHRFFGTTLLIISLFIILKNMIKGSGNLIQNIEIQFSVMVIIQFCLGVLTLIFNIPIVLAVAHQLCACLVLLLSFKKYYYISSR